jgi:hypothetical protein
METPPSPDAPGSQAFGFKGGSTTLTNICDSIFCYYNLPTESFTCCCKQQSDDVYPSGHEPRYQMRKYSDALALLAVTITSTLALAQDRVRIEASRGVIRYDDVKWSALSCYSPPCAANQPLDTNGNGKPYLLQIDQCDSKVEAWEGNGELIEKGTKMLGFPDCTLFFATRNSSVGREIIRTCPIGSRCHIETSIVGDSGIPFIVNIERIK